MTVIVFYWVLVLQCWSGTTCLISVMECEWLLIFGCWFVKCVCSTWIFLLFNECMRPKWFCGLVYERNLMVYSLQCMKQGCVVEWMSSIPSKWIWQYERVLRLGYGYVNNFSGWSWCMKSECVKMSIEANLCAYVCVQCNQFMAMYRIEGVQNCYLAMSKVSCTEFLILLFIDFWY